MTRRILRRILKWTPSFVLGGLIALRRGSIVPILLYHANYGPTHNMLIADNVHNINPDLFTRQVRYLRKHFTIVSLDDAFDACERSFTRKPIAAITFDDGYSSIFGTALPILEDMDVPSSVFLTTAILENGAFWRDRVRWVISQGLTNEFLAFATRTDDSFLRIRPLHFYGDTKNPGLINSKLVDQALIGFIDERGAADSVASMAREAYCTPEQVKDLDSSNVSIGSHTRNHYVLSSMGIEEQRDEIRYADAYLDSLVKSPSRILSIPFGGSADYTAETLGIVADLEYKGYLLSDNKLNRLTNKSRRELSGLAPLDRFMPPPDMKSYIFQFLK